MLNQFICTYCGELQYSELVRPSDSNNIIVKECIRCGEPRMMDKEARDEDRKSMKKYFKKYG